MNISISYYTSRGGRENNEDAISVLESADSLLAVVADGLGGCQYGEEASQMAVRTLNQLLSCGRASEERLKDALTETNKIIRETQKQYQGMRTTASVLWMDQEVAFVGHVGDSRIYQIRDGEIVFQSIDHSVAQMAVLVGEITQEEIRTHRDRNKLVRALGSTEQVKPDVQQLMICPGDVFLLCSDGFWEMITEEQMLETLRISRNVNGWLADMRRLAEGRMGPKADNHSAIAVIWQGEEEENS